MHSVPVLDFIQVWVRYQRPNPKENHGCMGPCAGVDYNLTSPYVHSRVDSNSFTMGNPMPESTLTLCQSRLTGANMGKKSYSNLCEKVIRQMRPETDSFMFFLNCLVRRGGRERGSCWSSGDMKFLKPVIYQKALGVDPSPAVLRIRDPVPF